LTKARVALPVASRVHRPPRHLRGFLREQLADDRLVGVGHRVVHGGPEYAEPVRVDHDALKALERFIPLAPLHQPHNLSPIAAMLERAPELPQVACFDTAFHRTNPDVAQRFALPAELHEAGVRRYGFHGLSYEYIAAVLGRSDARAAAGGDVRYGGLYDLLGISRDYDSDRVMARFAVVQRERMVAW
jgi:acetate kinase